jgi:hypothetical protein
MGIEIALMAAALATSVAGTITQQKQVAGAAKYANAQKRAAYEKSVAVQRAQAQVSGLEKKRMIQDRYEQFMGATKVSGADRGALGGRTETSLMQGLGISAARESAKVSMEQRLGSQSFAINSTPQWMVAQSSSPILAGIEGGLQGLQMGLGVQGQINQNNVANEVQNVGGGFSGLPNYAVNPNGAP